MKSIISFFAKEHLFGNLITLIVISFGIYSLFKIRRDIWPKVDLHITTIQTMLPGASTEQIEKLVINPIESSLKEVDGIKKIHSTATESVGVTVVQLDPDARDPDKTNDDIQRAVDRTDDLPKDVEKPVITIVDSGVMPIIELAIGGKDATEMELRDFAKLIADEVSLMPGIARVTKQGLRKKEYKIEAVSEKLAIRNVSLSQLVQSIGQRNISLPGGSLTNKAGFETLVRTEGQYENAEQILDTILVSNDSGYGSRIADVATVTPSLAKPETLYHYNSEDSVNLIISKKEKYDVLKLVNNLKEKVSEYSSKYGDKFQLGTSNDFSIYLRTRINALSSNLLTGLILILIVLSLLLPWQVTLVVAIGMPLSLLSAILVVYLMGSSLNLLSLMGLIIVIGMLVDDAVVVCENIWRRLEEGDELYTAVVEGTHEVLGAVVASVLTTVSAFGPMLFMTGIFGAFVFEIPFMVILALCFSLLEAFVIMPSHFMSWVGPSVAKIKLKQSQKKPWWDNFVNRYANWIIWTLKRRYTILVINIIIFFGSVGLLVATGKFVLFPEEGVEIFFVQVEAEENVSLRKMEELVRPIEKKIIESLPKSELMDVVSHIGIIQQDMMDPLTKRGSQYANIRITLTPQSQRERTAAEVVDSLRPILLPSENVKKISFEPVKQGPPQGRPIAIDLMGDSFETLNAMAEEFKAELAKIEGVKDIRDSYLPGKAEWQVQPNNKELSYGLSFAGISESVRAAFDGIVASSVRALDEEIDLRVTLKTKTGSVEEQLQQLKIGNNQGNLVTLPTVATFAKKQSLSSLSHTNYKRVVNVSAGLDTDILSPMEVNGIVYPILAKISAKYPGYKYESSGEDKDTEESMQSLMVAFIFAACFIFALLIMTFKNLLQPVLILCSIPLGFVGVIWSMYIHNRPFSFMAMLGVIALAGVIVNNAIVFTDFVNSSRKKGIGLDESIIQSAKTRIRPILLTTLTTVCGLLPTAYGSVLQETFGFGGGDPFVIPIALALAWGLIFGATMTVLFFPAFIRIVDDVINLIDKMLGKKQNV